MAITQDNLEFHTRNHAYLYVSWLCVLKPFPRYSIHYLAQSKKLKSRDLLINKTFKLEQQFLKSKVLQFLLWITSHLG